MLITVCLIVYQKVVWQVWIFIQYSLKLATKLEVYLCVLISQKMYNLQIVWVKIQVTMQDVLYTAVRHA